MAPIPNEILNISGSRYDIHIENNSIIFTIKGATYSDNQTKYRALASFVNTYGFNSIVYSYNGDSTISCSPHKDFEKEFKDTFELSEFNVGMLPDFNKFNQLVIDSTLPLSHYSFNFNTWDTNIITVQLSIPLSETVATVEVIDAPVQIVKGKSKKSKPITTDIPNVQITNIQELEMFLSAQIASILFIKDYTEHVRNLSQNNS